MATHAQKALDELDSGTALALALAASDIENPPKEVVQTLKRAAYAPAARRQYTVTLPSGEIRDIYSMAITADGTTALLGMAGGSMASLDIESGSFSHPFAGHNASVMRLVFSPDGGHVLSGGADAEVILWQVDTGEEIQRLSGHTGIVYALDISPDGKMAVSGGQTNYDLFSPGELFLWDLESGELIHRFEGGHLYALGAAAFSPDGQIVSLQKKWRRDRF